MKYHLFTKDLAAIVIGFLIATPMQAGKVEIDETTFPDETFREYVYGFDTNGDLFLDDEEIGKVTKINVQGRDIKSLKGIECFTELKYLNCQENLLTELDLTKCTELMELSCNNCRLETLAVSGCTKLWNLGCNGNKLTTLDLTNCPQLYLFGCAGNQFETLKLVDCPTLHSLNCSNNQLSTLDLSNCPELSYLTCNNNQLTSFNITKCKDIISIECKNNQFTALDLTKNEKILYFYCENNRLTSLKFSKNGILNTLFCENNQLSGAAMDELIASLPIKRSAQILILNSDDSVHEQNICTTIQVGALMAKKWTTYHHLNGKMVEYSGSTYQEGYHAFLKEGKTWTYQEYYNNGWTGERWTKDVSYVINGTTEIDGKTYYKMYRISEDGSQYYCNLREEDRKVWQYTRDNGERLLYDFGMSVGDSYMPSNEPFYYQLTAIKPMQFHNGQLLNVLYYDILIQGDPEYPASYFASAPIVEGVGCEEGWNITGLYAAQPTNGIVSGEHFLSCYEDGKCIFTADDFNDLLNPKPDEDIAYRPFIEDGKVWKVGNSTSISDNLVNVVDYYYFDGDTIVDGKTCKQMMCQRYVSPDFSDEYWTPTPSLSKMGAWYEEDQKVYFYDERKQSMRMMYDFSLAANDTLKFLTVWSSPFIIGPKQTGGIEGFKGVYRDIRMCGDEGQSYHDTFWLEGVGCLRGPISNPCNPILADPVPEFLMSCTVGDKVIYLNDDCEDGATPGETAGARKNRLDFTHTIKTKPKARSRRSDEVSLYGEYNDLRLGIDLNPLDDTYLVRITDEPGKVVYEKAINAGTIVALSIDISAYTKGCYIVTVENSEETFTGEFDTQPTGIEAITNKKGEIRHDIYNLHGQRLSSLQKGLNIVNGQKIYVK